MARQTIRSGRYLTLFEQFNPLLDSWYKELTHLEFLGKPYVLIDVKPSRTP